MFEDQSIKDIIALFTILVKDIALVLFGAVALWLNFRENRRRTEELNEKYFERRYDLFSVISEATTKALTPRGSDFMWFSSLSGKKERVGFLFGKDAEVKFSELFDLLLEYQSALEIEETADRVREAKKIRTAATKKFQELRQILSKKISLNR